MNTTYSTIIGAGYVRRGEVLAFGGGTLEVSDFELGPEEGEVSFFGPSRFEGHRGERYIFSMSDSIEAISWRSSQWEA